MFQLIRLIKRILKLSGTYAGRIKGAFVLSAVKSMMTQMPVFVAYLVLLQFYENKMTTEKCIYTGIAMVGIVAVQALAHLYSDRLQSAAGYMVFAEKRMELAWKSFKEASHGIFHRRKHRKNQFCFKHRYDFYRRNLHEYHCGHDELYF